MMSDHDFDQKLRHIEDQYAAKREGAEAYRDQEMARLFEECEWTQERIAGRMGKKQAWVSYRLKFGAFLKFITSGDNSPVLQSLTERRFREHWKRTTGKEKDRFAQVADVLRNGIPTGAAALHEKPGIRRAVLAVLEDGKWYTVSQVAATVAESLPGVLDSQVQACISVLRRDGRTESKSAGPGRRDHKYRLARGKPVSPGGPPSPVAALFEQAEPLIDELDEIGRMHEFRMSPVAVRMIAVKLRRLFDSVLQGATA